MKTSRKIIILLLSIIILLTAIIILVAVNQESTAVLNVIDGDTFTLTTGEKVRLIGIDAPEKGDYYYNESKQALKELVEGKIVFLEKDISNTDKYDRLLRYVYVDGISVNFDLISNGFVQAKEYPPDIKYAIELKQAEDDAKANNFGIWSEYLEENPDCTLLGCPKGTIFVGSKNSNKYHGCSSRFARSILLENIVCFSSESDALEQGYIASE